MRYFSDLTKKFYNTATECEKAEEDLRIAQKKQEEEAKLKTNARKEDAAKVEAAFNEMVAARKKYEKALREFCEKHGAYHRTIKPEGDSKSFDWRDLILDLL